MKAEPGNVSEIRLRDSITRRDIVGTVESGVAVGELDMELTLIANPNDGGKRFELEWDGVAAIEYSETERDDTGDRLFFNSEGERVPERYVEPYVPGMSRRRFSKRRIVVELVGDNLDTLKTATHDVVESVMSHASESEDVYAATSNANDSEVSTINATEMALWLLRTGVSPGLVGLDEVGRDLVPQDGGNDDEVEPTEEAWRRAVNAGRTVAGFAEWAESLAEPQEEETDRSAWEDRRWHPVGLWKQEVENDETRESYAEWSANREEQASVEGMVICEECGAFNEPGSACASMHCEELRG